MVDYLPLPDDQNRVFFEYTNYAFSPQTGPVEYDPEEHDTPRFNLGSPRGLYGDGESDEDPLVVCRQYWLEANIRGETHPVAGLAGVASPPESRRKGLVRKLLECSLGEYRDRGRAVSVLWPFRYDFYRKYGWDTANDRVSYDCEPDALSFATGAVDDPTFVAVGPDSIGALDAVYGRHSDEYALTLERDDAWWRTRILSNRGTDPFVYTLERDGTTAGYLVYTIDGEWGSRTMKVKELAFDDHDAFLSLLSFCHTHDSQVETVELPGPADSDLLDLTPKPKAVDCTVETGPMVRIVDVESALSMVTYPVGQSSETTRRLTLSVSDPLVEWNGGCFELEFTGGKATCDRTDDDPDAEIDIGALSQLLVGTRSARDLERVGRLRTASEAKLEALESLFPETQVYLREHF